MNNKHIEKTYEPYYNGMARWIEYSNGASMQERASREKLRQSVDFERVRKCGKEMRYSADAEDIVL